MRKEKRLTQQHDDTTIETHLIKNFAKRMLGSSWKKKVNICPRNRDESGWKNQKRK